MLDLLDVCKRIGPKFPLDAMFLDPHDRKLNIVSLCIAEWDDDMTYLYVEYPFYKNYILFLTYSAFMFLYNYNIYFHNKNLQYATKVTLGLLFITSNLLYFKYRK